MGCIEWVAAQVENARKLKEKLEGAGKKLQPIYGNLVDKVWGDARPAAPSAPLRVHPLEHAGKSVSDKLTAVRAKMKGGVCSVRACNLSSTNHSLPLGYSQKQ